MSGLSAADNELAAAGCQALADIAESEVVILVEALPDKAEPVKQRAPGVDPG